MPRTSLAAIVASLHGRSGKTLLARILAEYWLMAGERPLIFDTDAADRKLRDFFPDQAIVVDLHHVRDQMRLFDTLAAPSPQPRVVDVTHRSLGTFFNVMRNTDFVVEARSCHVEPVIFYMVDRSAESFEEGWDLRDRFEDCAFVVVDNAFLGEAGERVRHSGAYRALAAHDLRFDVPALDRRHFEVIDDPYLSLAEFM